MSVLATSCWVIDAGWNEPDNLQFLAPLLMTIYSLMVLIPLAAVVLLTRKRRATNSGVERWINIAVVLTAITGAAIWTFALIHQVRHLIITA